MVPLTTVTSVVEPILAVPVGENEFEGEVDSMSGVEVEGIGVIFDEVEDFGVVMMIVVEDVVNINAIDVVVIVVGVNGSTVVDGTGNVIALEFVVRNVASRNISTYPVVDDIGDTFVEITSAMDTGVSLIVKLPAGLVAAGLVAAGLVVAGSVPRLGI